MAVFATAITKSVMWRGQPEKFSNVYHHWFLDLGSDTASQLVDKLIAAEQPVHSTDVTFVEARVWGPVGDPAASDVIYRRDIPNTTKGTTTSDSTLDREACFVVKIGTDRQDIRSRKIYLRKWIHSCGLLGAPSGWKAGVEPAGPTPVLKFETYFNAIKDPVFGTVTGNLCSPRGAVHNNTWELYPYVEHHEFRY